jgi:hypothetical protein
VKPLLLNIGCGTSKIKGCVNIDCEKKCKPDLLHDFTKKPLPYKDGAAQEIYFFHTIEHIRKVFHPIILAEFARVLKKEGKLYISCPNFAVCSQYFLTNHSGQKEFWERTLFGRQLYPSDYHVCAMIPEDLGLLLTTLGFKNVVSYPEPREEFNFITTAVKGTFVPLKNYETLVRDAFLNDKYKLTKGSAA